MSDCCPGDPLVLSSNGFSRTTAAVHGYFLQLELQGFLSSDGNTILEERVLASKFLNKGHLLQHLGGHVGKSA